MIKTDGSAFTATDKLRLQERDVYLSVDIKVSPIYGEVFHVYGKHLLNDSFALTRGVCSGNKLEIGSVCASQLSMTLDNQFGDFDDVTFEGAELSVKVGIPRSDTAPPYSGNNASNYGWITLGYYTVDSPPRKLSSITVQALDRMAQLDKPLLERGEHTCEYWIALIEADCNVPLNNSLSSANSWLKLPLKDKKLSLPHEKEDLTYRDLLSYICQVNFCNAYFNNEGKLSFGWFDLRQNNLVRKEKIKQGFYNGTGGFSTNSEILCTRIPCRPNTKYSFPSGVRRATYYKADNTIIGTEGQPGTRTLYGITTPNDAVILEITFEKGTSVDTAEVYIGSAPDKKKSSFEITPANRFNHDKAENMISFTGVEFKKGDSSYRFPENIGNYYFSVENPFVNAKYTDNGGGNEIVAEEYLASQFTKFAEINGSGDDIHISPKSYLPLSASVKPFPFLEPMDSILYVDKYGNETYTVISNITFCLNKAMTVKAVGETETERGYATRNPFTAEELKIIEKLQQGQSQVLSTMMQAQLRLNIALSNGVMLHETVVNGQKYYHDKPNVADSEYILVQNSEGVAWTDSGWNSGNPVWQYGITSEGEAVLNTLTAYKINAELIRVDDLQALGATIGGWSIGNDGIYKYESIEKNGESIKSGYTIISSAKDYHDVFIARGAESLTKCDNADFVLYNSGEFRSGPLNTFHSEFGSSGFSLYGESGELQGGITYGPLSIPNETSFYGMKFRCPENVEFCLANVNEPEKDESTDEFTKVYYNIPFASMKTSYKQTSEDVLIPKYYPVTDFKTSGSFVSNSNEVIDNAVGLVHYRTFLRKITYPNELLYNHTSKVKFGCGKRYNGTPSVFLESYINAGGDISARLDVFGSEAVGQSNGVVLSLGRADPYGYVYMDGNAVHFLNSLSFNNTFAAEKYKNLWAGEMYARCANISSDASIKTDIAAQSTVLDLFSLQNSEIYSYKYLTSDERSSEADFTTSSVDERETCYGFVIGEGYNTPSEVISEDGKHINLYSMAAINWKATQELLSRLEQAENKLKEFENKEVS